MLSTPRRRLRWEIGLLRSAPPWLRPLADGEPDTLRTLGRALKGYFDAALAPCWTAIRAQAEADRALRARALLTGGTETRLSTLGPTLTWRSPLLEADYPLDRDLHLGGRGLLLIPSVFCWRNPITLADPGLPPVLVYPVRRGPGWWPSQGTPPTGRSTLGSLHARILRDAGLLASVRDRNTVLHTPTPLGTDLLAANPSRA